MTQEENENTVSVKLFVGFPLTSEIKMHLNRSQAWQQASVLHPAERDLVEVHHHGQDYVGRFLPQDRVILSEVQDNDMRAKQALQHYCPECNLDGMTLRVLPQVFVA